MDAGPISPAAAAANAGPSLKSSFFLKEGRAVRKAHRAD